MLQKFSARIRSKSRPLDTKPPDLLRFPDQLLEYLPSSLWYTLIFPYLTIQDQKNLRATCWSLLHLISAKMRLFLPWNIYLEMIPFYERNPTWPKLLGVYTNQNHGFKNLLEVVEKLKPQFEVIETEGIQKIHDGFTDEIVLRMSPSLVKLKVWSKEKMLTNQCLKSQILQHITYLSLYNTWIDDRGLEYLSNRTGLKVLSLLESQVTNSGLSSLPSSVTDLELSSKGLSGSLPFPLPAALTSLQIEGILEFTKVALNSLPSQLRRLSLPGICSLTHSILNFLPTSLYEFQLPLTLEQSCLYALPPLCTILKKVTITTEGEFNNLPLTLQSLEATILNSPKMNFGVFSNLTSLTLINASSDYFSSFPNGLTKLCLEVGFTKSEHFINLPRSLKFLEINSINIRNTAHFSNLPQLDSLVLRRNSVKLEESAHYFPSSLKHLGFIGCSFTQNWHTRLSPNLQSMYLEQVFVEPNWIQFLPSRLAALEVSNVAINGSQLHLLPTSLKTLKIRGSRRFLGYIPEWHKNFHLRKLPNTVIRFSVDIDLCSEETLEFLKKRTNLYVCYT